jgi:type IV pilus assembly protein PilB
LDFSCILITEEKFEELYEILYSKRLGITESKDAEPQISDNINFMDIDVDEDFSEDEDKSPVYDGRDIEGEELVNFIIKDAILKGASDIHIEQDREGSKLRYRVDGILHDVNVAWLKRKMQDKIGSVVSRIKVMSNLDIAERRLPQDGVFRINYYDKTKNKKSDLDFRVATCRAIIGENVTVRILDSRKANVGLDSIGHSPHVLEPLRTLLKSSAGMILVSGPTGSGKTSTLYAALQFVYNPGIKIITAEDPIEYGFPGIMQTQIQPKIGLTFARLLRSFLRLDPDVILVGEIRDPETASIGFDAAQTGHLLLSTIHTNDAISAIPRLLDLKIDKGQIASCLMGVIAQRLIRKICPSCVTEYAPDEGEWAKIFTSYPSELTFYKGEGCEACDFTGYKGRILLSEFFIIGREIAQALNRGFDENSIRRLANESGMMSMLEDGLTKLKETTLSEMLRVVPHEMINEYRKRKASQDIADSIFQKQQKTSFSPYEGNQSAESMLISDPASEKHLIEEFYSTFKSCGNGSSDTSYSVDFALFEKFITQSFQQLCKTYQCRQVTFMIREQHGKSELSAVPMM